MSDTLPTVWPLEPHTQAKHAVLIAYLEAWAAILSRQAKKLGIENRPLRIIDGFAGPGIYEGGEAGSPILSLNAILKHEVRLPARTRFLFIENDKERLDSLEEQLRPLHDQIAESETIEIVKREHGDCERTLVEWLNTLDEQNAKPGPAFFFLDQFGYSDVSMDLIGRIMGYPMCEVFNYLNWSRMNNYMSDKAKWRAIDRAYGDQRWRSVFDLPAGGRATFMRESYKTSLRDNAHAKYTWHFGMCDESHKLIHWLFFCTNSIRGLEEMKRAMRSVDKTGCFQFSDRDNPDQFELFQNYSVPRLALDIRRAFKGQNKMVTEIKEFVLTETPEYKHKPGLRELEMNDHLVPLDPPAKRRKGTFPDANMRVKIL